MFKRMRSWAPIGALALTGCYGSVEIGFNDDDGLDTRPAVSLVASPDPVTQAGNLILSAAASDDHGIAVVYLYRLEGGSLEVLVANDTIAPYQWSVALTRADNGQQYYFARAIDGAGQSADSGVVGVTVAIP